MPKISWPIQRPVAAERSIKAFERAHFTRGEAEGLVLDNYIKVSSDLGRSLAAHRYKLVTNYVKQGLTLDEAIEYAKGFVEEVNKTEEYTMDALAEMLTFRRKFIRKPVSREVKESMNSAIQRYKGYRKRREYE